MEYVSKDFFGVRLMDMPVNDFSQFVLTRHGKEKGPINIMSLNLTSMRRFNKEMYDFANMFTFVTADGNGLVKISKLVGKPIHHQIAISTLSKELLAKASESKLSVFLLGGEISANKKAVESAEKAFPNIRVTGHHGYFDESNMESIIEQIELFKPDIILVGISSPKKERVIMRISSVYKDSVNVACGGFIDILAKKTKRAPLFVQKMALEWIYRFFQEPKRMFRPMIIDGCYFMFALFPKFLFYGLIKRNEKNLFQIVNG